LTLLRPPRGIIAHGWTAVNTAAVVAQDRERSSIQTLPSFGVAFRCAGNSEESMGLEFGGILGLVILVADIWAIYKIITGGGSTGSKLLWVLVILLLPVLGLLIWLIAGRR
jgi:hypothetical protein